MSKTLLLVCLALLLAYSQSQSAPVYSTFMAQQTQAGSPGSPFTGNHPLRLKVITTNKGAAANGVFRITFRTAPDAPLTAVYARLNYENEISTGWSLYDDVVVRFYEDEGGEIPTSVSNLVVNYRVIGWNNVSGGYDYNGSQTASGYSITLAYGNEHDYDDGESQRYRDYHLSPGDYIGTSITLKN